MKSNLKYGSPYIKKKKLEFKHIDILGVMASRRSHFSFQLACLIEFFTYIILSKPQLVQHVIFVGGYSHVGERTPPFCTQFSHLQDL